MRFATDVLPVDRASYWDLELAITDCGAGKPLTAFFGAREDILDPAVVSWWGESFVALLAGIVGQPHAAINELPLLGNVQAQRVLHDWNQAEPSFEPDATLYQCVAHQADLTPDASAVNDTKEQLSYRQLLSRADNYAAGLDAQGVDKGTCVGLCRAECRYGCVAVGRAAAGGTLAAT